MKTQLIFDEDIPTYKQLLAILREKDSQQLIRNDSVGHATVLVQNLVEHAEKEILLYSSSFCEEFYLKEEILEAFKKKKDLSVKVIIHYKFDEAEDSVGQNKTIARYNEILGDHVKIKFMNAEDNLKIEDISLNNFLVADEKGFRYEKSEPSKEACVSKGILPTPAVGSLNDPALSKELAEAFNKKFSQLS